MKELELEMIEVTKQYGVQLKNSLVTYGTIILYCLSVADVKKLSKVLGGLKAKIVTNEYDLTVGIVF